MNVRKLLETVTTSRNTLPIVCVYSILLAVCYGVFTKQLLLQVGCVALSAYFLVLLNNKYSLIRIYSRTVSSTYLILTMMCPFLTDSLHGSIATALFIGFYYMFFKAYQDHRAPGTIMYAFACLGLISTQFIQVVFFLPIALILMYKRIFAGNGKTLSAAFMGFLLPYWLWLAWAGMNGSVGNILEHLKSITVFTSPLVIPLGIHYLLTIILIIAITTISIVQCLSDSASDKIKTRMIYDVFIWMDVFAVVFLLLQPQHYHFLLRMIIVSSAPLIAHYFTLSQNKKITPYVFLVTISLVLMLTIFNLWM